MIYIWQKHAPFVIKSVHRRHSPPGETVQLMRIHPGRPEASQPASQPASQQTRGGRSISRGTITSHSDQPYRRTTNILTYYERIDLPRQPRDRCSLRESECDAVCSQLRHPHEPHVLVQPPAGSQKTAVTFF